MLNTKCLSKSSINKVIVNKLKDLNYVKLLKCITGSIMAISLSQLLCLKYAYATGIITLLTIQETKKETLMISIKRLIIFIIMTILAITIFSVMGYSVWAFGVVLIPYLFICSILDMKEAIAPIAVLCTHYISEKSCNMDMVINEFLILFIGAGIGVLLNMFMQDTTHRIKRIQADIEEKMKNIIGRMAIYIEKTDKSEYKGDCFIMLEDMLDELEKEALYYMNNRFIGENDYFYKYVRMRVLQCELLKRIYNDIVRITMIPTQAKPLAMFLKEISREFHEVNNGEALMVKHKELEAYYKQEALPVNRDEFENRAVLYHIMEDLGELIKIKYEFVKGQEII